MASIQGHLGVSGDETRRSWWEVAVVTIAAGIFVWLASNVRRQPIAINAIWTSVIIAASTGPLAVAAVMLWRRIRFN
jgi:hypothetical protein